MRPGRSRRDGILIPKNIQLREYSLSVVVADYFIPIRPGWGSSESHALFSFIENDDKKTFVLRLALFIALAAKSQTRGEPALEITDAGISFTMS